ncbi:MAG: hydantoinase/oxoprolinase family protein [Lautropia sp.]
MGQADMSRRGARCRIGVDVGGTFTDLALYDEAAGEMHVRKILSTPADPSIAVLQGLDELVARAGLSVAALAEAIHATTVATNAVIQRNGPATGLLTTKGFRDVLLIGRQKRWDLYDNSIDKPVPVVTRDHIWEAAGRMRHDGTELTALDEAGVRRAARQMVAAGIRTVAIVFLHSYANASHERRAAQIVRDAAPGLSICLSSDVSPVYREYERASTTTLNAYLMPIVGDYVRRIERGLLERGFRQKLFIMQSNGGVATPDIVEQFPIRIIESGPAAGVITAARYTGAAGTDNLLSFDMGGTTAKVCLIEAGRPALSSQFEVDMVHLKRNSGLPINVSAIDLVEIGSGGGSIARVEMGAIAVGPQSAGSEPGPICYARGGVDPTVTDADLVLGYLDADHFLGGEMHLDLPAARRGIDAAIGKPLGIDTAAAAWGIHEVVTATMAQAARVVSVSRGKDPRDFALVPFGGAGPVHGVRLARMLGCSRVVFPHDAGVESAVGLLVAEPAFDLVQTRIVALDAGTITAINAIYGELEAAGRRQLAACGIRSGVRLRRSADMRFRGQGYEITVDLPQARYRAADARTLREAFADAYASTYGERSIDREDPIEIVHFRIKASGRPGTGLKPILRPPPDHDAPQALKAHRQAYFPETGGFTRCPVFDRYRLKPGERMPGPALIEERESTIVVIPDCDAHLDPEGHVVVDLAPSEPLR